MYDLKIRTHPLLWYRASVYPVWWKSIHPNLSYCVHKGENASFLPPLLYFKNSRKIRKICTTPKFKLILCYGLEQLCTKFGENTFTQTWVIVSTRVKMSHFCYPLLYEKNSRKIRKICTTPKFKLILCYSLEHLCTKFGENLWTQTRVIVSTRVKMRHFCDPYCT